MTYSKAWRPKTERLEQDLAGLKARLETRKSMVNPFQQQPAYKGLSQGTELMGGVKKALGYVGIDPTLPWNRKRATQEELRQRYEVQQKSFGHGALSPTGMTLIERKPIPGTHDYVYSQPAGGVDPIAGGGKFQGEAAKNLGEVIPTIIKQIKTGGMKLGDDAMDIAKIDADPTTNLMRQKMAEELGIRPQIAEEAQKALKDLPPVTGAAEQVPPVDDIEQMISKFKSVKSGAKPIDEAEALINKYKQTKAAGGGGGYFHGSPTSGLKEIKPTTSIISDDYGNGVQFALDRKTAEYYSAGRANQRAFVLGDTPIEPKPGTVYELKGGPKNPLVIENGAQKTELFRLTRGGDEGVESERAIAKWAKQQGYDGIVDKTKQEGIWFTDEPVPVTSGGGTVPPKVPPVATAGTPAPNPHIGASGLVQKDFDDMKEVIAKVKSARAVTTQIRKVDRKARVAEAYRILQKETGPDAFQKARSALKGEYETANLSTTPTLQLLDKFKVALRDKVAAGELRLFDGDHAASGLDILKQKLIDPTGPIPQPHQMKALKQAFGPEFGLLLDELSKSKGNRVWNEIGGILNIPRALASTFDMSGVYLQAGLATAGHPVLAAKAMKATLKTMFSEKNYAKVIEGVMERPNFGRMVDELGIDITWGKVDWVKGKDGKLVQKVVTNLSQKEEAWMSNIIHKVPILGTITKSSERAYNMYLNMMRVGLADDALKSLDKFPTHEEWYKQMGNLINISTGRGNLFGLGSSIKGSLPLLNSLFFSPKLMFSRIEYPILLLNPATSPVVRKAAARDLVAWLALGAGVIGGIKMAAPESEFNIDPRSPDFGKIKVGNTRLDFWSGFSQYIRLTAQLGTASKMISGEKVDANRGDVLMRFLQGKLAPAPSILWDMLRGQTFMGEAVEPTPEFLGSQAYQRLVSFFIQDVIDAVNDRGASGIPLVLPSFFGANAQTYETATPTSGGNMKIPNMKIPKLK